MSDQNLQSTAEQLFIKTTQLLYETVKRLEDPKALRCNSSINCTHKCDRNTSLLHVVGFGDSQTNQLADFAFICHQNLECIQYSFKMCDSNDKPIYDKVYISFFAADLIEFDRPETSNFILIKSKTSILYDENKTPYEMISIITEKKARYLKNQ